MEGARIKVRGYARGEEIHVNSLSEVEVFVDFVNISELDEKVGERVNVKALYPDWVSRKRPMKYTFQMRLAE